MLLGTHVPRNTPIRAGFLVSIALHAAVVLAVCWRPLPPLVQPTSVRFGEHGTSMTPIYFARRGSEDLLPADTRSQQSRTSMRYPVSRQRRAKSDAAETGRTQQAETNHMGQPTQAPRAGSPFGSLAEGSTLGEEIKPALPIYGPQPQVAAYEVPSGLEGDIVVE